MAFRHNDQEEYFSAHFFAGVAVESILRALSVKDGDSFDNSHSISDWTKKAYFIQRNTRNTDKDDEYSAILNDMDYRWRANQRYYTIKMLDTWLHHINKDGNVKGDRVKLSSKRMLEQAHIIVSIGKIRWNKKYSKP